MARDSDLEKRRNGPALLHRVKPRNVFDLGLGLGTGNLFHQEGARRYTASLEIAKLANVVVLYNFLSTFSGRHCLQPRAVIARFGMTF